MTGMFARWGEGLEAPVGLTQSPHALPQALEHHTHRYLTRSHKVSLHLTSLGPQLPHKPVNRPYNSWSELFDRIFRNEGVTGSNPVSSTICPGRGHF